MTRREAQIRNHNIMRLKGMYQTANNIMEPHLAAIVTEAIEIQLTKMGATTPKQARQKYMKELENLYEKGTQNGKAR